MGPLQVVRVMVVEGPHFHLAKHFIPKGNERKYLSCELHLDTLALVCVIMELS